MRRDSAPVGGPRYCPPGIMPKLEAEAILVLHRAALRICEVPVQMSARDQSAGSVRRLHAESLLLSILMCSIRSPQLRTEEGVCRPWACFYHNPDRIHLRVVAGKAALYRGTLRPCSGCRFRSFFFWHPLWDTYLRSATHGECLTRHQALFFFAITGLTLLIVELFAWGSKLNGPYPRSDATDRDP